MKRLRTAPHVPVLSAVLPALLAAAGLAVSASASVDPALSQPPAARPTPATGPIGPRATKTVIVLVEVSGPVQIRRPQNIGEDLKKGWERPVAGAALPEGTQIRTGPNGSARVQIGATQAITVDKFSMMTIRVAVNDAGTERTRIDLPMGRLGIDVDSTRIANDVQIATPQTTLAVTGTTFFIEHTSAFGTVARGAETNKGSFNVVYLNGAVATVTGSEETSSATPDPAQAQQERAQVDTNDPGARESDERAVAQRASGSGEAVGLNPGLAPTATDLLLITKPITDEPPAAISMFLSYDQATGAVLESDLSGGQRRTIVESVNIAPEAPFSGLSIIEGAGGQRTLYLLRSDVQVVNDVPVASNRLYSLDLANPAAGFGLPIEAGGNGKALLQGLGSIGDRLFAHGFGLGRERAVDSVYELAPAGGTLRTAMSLPGVRVGGVGGSNERGSLVLAGKLDLFDGSDQHVFLEVDPRTNYLITAAGGSDMALEATEGTFLSAGLDPSTIDNISGLAVVDGVLVMSATAMVGDTVTNVVVQYDPAAAGTAGSPRLRRVEAVKDPSFIGALASERGLTVRPSRPLDDSPGPIDLTTINRMFGQMAYGEEALASNVLERVVASEIITTSRDPEGCAASGALDALPTILRRHVDKTSGVGRTVAEFRGSLPFLHPCGAD